MGAGIAQILAQRGLQVILSDRKYDIIEKGLGHMQRAFEKKIKEGRMTQADAHSAIGRVETAVSLEVRTEGKFPCEACLARWHVSSLV